MCQRALPFASCLKRGRTDTHLQVLLGSLLPLLGHGTGPDGAGEHASESEESEGTGDDGGGDEENLAALIRRRGTAGAVGTKGDKVGCTTKLTLACEPCHICLVRSARMRCVHQCHGPTRVCPYQLRYVMRMSMKLNGSVGGVYAPAFFSCMVNSFQSVFMRSLSDIQRSACSWGGC